MATISLSPGACLREASPAKALCGGQALRRRQRRGRGGGGAIWDAGDLLQR